MERREDDSLDALVAFAKALMHEHDYRIGQGLSGYHRKAWHDTEHASLFARAGLWWVKGYGSVHSFDILRVEVRNPQRGFFGKMLENFQLLCDSNGRVLKVENVVNDHLRASLDRRGYVAPEQEPSSRYRLPLPLVIPTTEPYPTA